MIQHPPIPTAHFLDLWLDPITATSKLFPLSCSALNGKGAIKCDLNASCRRQTENACGIGEMEYSARRVLVALQSTFLKFVSTVFRLVD